MKNFHLKLSTPPKSAILMIIIPEFSGDCTQEMPPMSLGKYLGKRIIAKQLDRGIWSDSLPD